MRARAVGIATGAQYRRLDVENLAIHPFLAEAGDWAALSADTGSR
ncbi:MAG TPA: hypothetical protein VM755_10130 [Stellaceae bacterium]|nr:hypothetical protein [Stellaceae bacterium]